MSLAGGRLTLTFDNGPDPAVTPHVLEELERRSLRAIFFPLGERLKDAKLLALMAAARDAGHRIGNHTYSHPRPFGSLDDAAAVTEIVRTDELLGDLREPDRLFRPSAGGGVIGPGVLNEAAIDHMKAHGHTLVMWNVVCEDWARSDDSWIDLAFHGMGEVDWAVLVLHDIDSGAMTHLGTFLDRVLDGGWEITADLPPAQTPILHGTLRGPIDHLLPRR